MAKRKKRVLLLDGDIFAYHAAAAAEVESDFGNGFIVLWSDFDEALRNAVSKIESIKEKLKADEVIFCHTDAKNWRKKVLPTYKSNRKDTRKPIALKRLKEELADRYDGYIRDELEADDVLGILATRDKFMPDYEKIIVSEDKDLKTIPALMFNPAKDTKPKLVTQEEADRFHYIQALAGDITDGYKGCPNIGMDTAATLIDELSGVEAYEHTFKSGVRKGQTETRWKKVEMDNAWDVIVSHYAKAGLGEDEALRQARVARILRSSDYDFKNKEVKLYVPPARA